MAAAGFEDLIDELLAVTNPIGLRDPGGAAQANGDQATEQDELHRANPFEVLAAGDFGELARLMQDEPTAVNRRDVTSGRSLLHEACVSGSLEAAKLLVQLPQTDLMLRTMLGRCTPLHLAVDSGHRAIVFLLLSHGADVLSRDRFGCSPMHYVNSITVAKLLVQYGGKVLDYNSKKKTALESVEGRDDGDIDPTNNDSASHRAARVELVKYLRTRAELEFKAKLELLRTMRKQANPSTLPHRKTRRNATIFPNRR